MPNPRLLVSVRDADEALAALHGGADLIDAKEPANGPLGRADPPVIAEIVRAVAGRVPVSAAGGELSLCPASFPSALALVKFGLAGWRGRDWPAAWERVRATLPSGCGPVAVAYADWQRANSPPPVEVAAFAVRDRFAAFLMDTFDKDRSTLLDRLSIDAITELTRTCQSGGVPVALAGSLGLKEIERLRSLGPDWFAVRGAACVRGRGGRVDIGLVRHLVCTLRE